MTNKNKLEQLSARIYKETGMHIPVNDPQLGIFLVYENVFYGIENRMKKKNGNFVVYLFLGILLSFGLGWFVCEKVNDTQNYFADDFFKHTKLVSQNIQGQQILFAEMPISNEDSLEIGNSVLISEEKKIYVPLKKL